jgi:polar amino acid transport system substrate-binding protein
MTLAAPLRVGVDLAPPAPMCFGVPGTPEFKGFEVDLIHAIAERLGRPMQAEASLWAELLDRLNGDALDLICTAVTVTPERQQRFEFSEPYLRTRLAIVCRRDRPVRALTPRAHRVAVRVNTPAERHARQAVPREVLSLHFNDEIYRTLEDDRVDAVVDDHPIGAWFAAQSPLLTVGAPVPDTDAVYSLAFRRGNVVLKDTIDRVLREVFADGSYARFYDTWMAPIVGDACDVTR